mgnify:CR=1 FL=1
MSYVVKDENGETMRVVGRQEEARQIVQQREGWTFKCVRKPVQKIDLSSLGEAPF